MSNLRRFFVDAISEPLYLTGEEFRHAVNVLRIKEGEEVIVCDNSSFEYVCKVKKITKTDMLLEVENKRQAVTEPKQRVCLLSGYLKGDKTELVVQKAVELGVYEVVIFNSKYCSAYMNDNKLARLNKVSLEAAKQCGRAVAPKVIYADTFEKALGAVENFKNKLFACEFATKSEVDFNSLSGSTAIVVGSEGGFSEEEAELATKKDFKTVFLGSRILRAETCAIALTGIVMHSLKELE